MQAVFDIVRTLPVRLYASLMEWINKYSKNAKVLDTLIQINLVGEHLASDSFDDFVIIVMAVW